MIQISKVTPI